MQFHAFSWKNEHMRDLGTVDGDGCSIAETVNSSGEVAGISADCAFKTLHGFYVKGNGPREVDGERCTARMILRVLRHRGPRAICATSWQSRSTSQRPEFR
jgi:uncharacterized membrane protein